MFGIIRRDPETVLVPPTTTLIQGRIIWTGPKGHDEKTGPLSAVLEPTCTESLQGLSLSVTVAEDEWTYLAYTIV